MEREIKFRSKSTSNKEWIYGNYAIIDGLPSIVEGSIEFIDGSELRSYSWDYVIPETICQFTGLHDKNGKEIYEGDILRSVVNPDIIMYVSYDVEETSFMAIQINKYTGTDLESRCHIRREWITGFPKEVIGNIYDNPELIKREE